MAIHGYRTARGWLILPIGLLLSASAWAGQAPTTAPAAPRPTAPRPTVTAMRLNDDEAIKVDGRLDEEAWKRAVPAADFKQSEPKNGEPATERTEVRLIFGKGSLYIGARMFDSQPDALLANQMARDGSLTADDRFMWTLDPFFTQRSGYFFEVNPAGAIGDAQLVPPQGATAAATTQNRAWDGIWLARVSRDDLGWTAEIEIPFQTLNFDPGAEAWGANFQRTVQRKNEDTFWYGWGRNQGLSNLAATSTGRIVGIKDVSQGHGFDFVPYGIGTFRDEPRGTVHSEAKADAGIDVFYSLTPQLKTNLTVNTDFAQTDVDDRQVNLTRFPLFFPEKRAFFLEGAGNFDFGREARQNLTAFFTRRIGLTDAGLPQRIDYGVRMIGQAGRYDLGVLQVRTAEEDNVKGEDFTVFRPKRRFWRQSYAGLIYTRRSTRDSELADRHTIGADFQLATTRFRGNQNLRFGGFVIKTPAASHSGNDTAWGLRIDYPNDLWQLNLNYSDFQKNMMPAVGFTERSNFQRLFGVVQWGPRPKNSKVVRQVAIRVTPELYSNHDGEWGDRAYDFRIMTLTLQSGDTVTADILKQYEHPPASFRIGVLRLPSKKYEYTRYSAGFTTATRRKVSGDMTVTTGTFYSGDREDVTGSVNLRPRRGWLATFSGTYSHVDLEEGEFSTRVVRAIVNTQFSPFTSISNNVQYDSASNVLGWQFRFRWILRPGNDIYVVWLNNWLDVADHLTTQDRSLATKVIYTYRF